MDSVNVRVISVGPTAEQGRWVNVTTTSPRLLLLDRKRPEFHSLSNTLRHLAQDHSQARMEVRYTSSGPKSGCYLIEGVAVALSIGQQTTMDELEIDFEEVMADTRCPPEKRCEWSGAFIGKFEFARKGKRETVYGALVGGKYTTISKGSFATIEERISNYGGDGERKAHEVFGYSFHITRVDPSPKPDKIPRDQYRVWVSARKL